MNTIIELLSSLPLIFFWSAVLSFVPVTLYLLLINPPLNRAEQRNSLGIYILKEESLSVKRRRGRLRLAGAIYALCVFFFTSVFFINSQYGHPGLGPFNVLSSVSIIFFWISVLSYLPVAAYLFIKNPWKSKEEGVGLTGIYIAYGIGMLIFSVAYAYSWVKEKGLLVGAGDCLASLATVIFCAAIISYLPILLYVYLKAADPLKNRKIEPNVVFIIYSLCFLFISAVYINKWVLDKKAGVDQLPLRFYFEIK